MNKPSNIAKVYIDKYDNYCDKMRVCPICGFENTMQLADTGYCNVCNKKYNYPQILPVINKKINCCIIS